jgi:hypothetical protein
MSKDQKGDLLSGMKSICQHLNGISEATVLKWYREYDLPIRKAGGVWIGSRKKMDQWSADFVGGGAV